MRRYREDRSSKLLAESYLAAAPRQGDLTCSRKSAARRQLIISTRRSLNGPWSHSLLVGLSPEVKERRQNRGLL